MTDKCYIRVIGGTNTLQTLTLAISGVLAIGLIWTILRLSQLANRMTSALGSTDAGDLESQLTGYATRVESVDRKLEQLTAAYQELTVSSSLASQKISVVRFNPFGDTGGDQSFTLAVLDAHDSGYVLTSIHGREGTRVYVKPIDYGKSKYTLSNEEKQAFNQAAKRVPNFKEAKDGEKN